MQYVPFCRESQSLIRFILIEQTEIDNENHKIVQLGWFLVGLSAVTMDFLKILRPRKNKFSEELITQSVDLDIENVAEETEKNDEVISFRVDYLGHLLVGNIPQFNADHGLKFLKMERDNKKMKIQRGVILISHNYVKLTDMRRREIFKIPILRISSCSMDPFNKKVFFFISTHENGRTYHAFFCEKWKNAYNAAQAIAHMFGLSHEKYVIHMQNKKFVGENTTVENVRNGNRRMSVDMMDFSEDLGTSSRQEGSLTNNWVSFED